MDDTKAGDIEIAEKYKLPKYIVTEHDTGDLHVCKKEGETCADCSKCYEFPMEDVKTILRSWLIYQYMSFIIDVNSIKEFKCIIWLHKIIGNILAAKKQ